MPREICNIKPHARKRKPHARKCKPHARKRKPRTNRMQENEKKREKTEKNTVNTKACHFWQIKAIKKYRNKSIVNFF